VRRFDEVVARLDDALVMRRDKAIEVAIRLGPLYRRSGFGSDAS
jgi:hypothetical protein